MASASLRAEDGERGRSYSRPGNDMTRHFPLIAEALTGLRSRSCIIDGEMTDADLERSSGAFTRLAYRPLVTDHAMEAWYDPSIA